MKDRKAYFAKYRAEHRMEIGMAQRRYSISEAGKETRRRHLRKTKVTPTPGSARAYVNKILKSLRPNDY